MVILFQTHLHVTDERVTFQKFLIENVELIRANINLGLKFECILLQSVT